MACPPTAYTVRGGVGTVETAATVAAALLPDDPDPADPGKLLALPAPSPEPQAEPQRVAACCFRGWRGTRHPLPFDGGHRGFRTPALPARTAISLSLAAPVDLVGIWPVPLLPPSAAARSD